MLNGHDGCSSFADLRLGRKREIDSGREGDDGCDWRGVRIFVMAELAIVQNAIHPAEVIDCGALDVDLRSVDSFGQFGGLVIHILQIIL